MITVKEYLREQQPEVIETFEKLREEGHIDNLTKFFLWLEGWMDPLCEMIRK